MDDSRQFAESVRRNIRDLGADAGLRDLSTRWIQQAGRHGYSYNFTWLGRPIIQFPQDVVALQEVIWRVQPRLVVETGIARGGSIVFYASILELLGGDGRVLGIDIDIRKHNRDAIEAHPMAHRIDMIEGSSIDAAVVERVAQAAAKRQPVLVILDSSHTHEHVLRELELYAPLVTAGSYLIVLDTIVDDLPTDYFPNRPWGPGNSPKSAVHAFLETTDRFVIDASIHDKLAVTVAPDGWLRCLSE